MAIKKLQNNYTTPEQSKRLLELGVPADSADMLWDGTYDLVNGWEFEDYPTFSDKHYSYYQGLYRKEDSANILPCWSVGRLIEIISICGSFVRTKRFKIEEVAYFYRETKKSVVDLAIDDIEILVNSDDMDFSKLEE